MIDLDGPAARRAFAGGAVIVLHVVVIAALLATGNLPPVLRQVLPARLILPEHVKPPAPPPIPLPALAAPPPSFVPLPEIQLAPPPSQPAAPRAITRAPPSSPAASHFGAATDSGLGLDVAASAGGGAGARGTLAGFEAAVRRQVLAGKRQPVLAWDRRNTCVVAFTVKVSASGGLAGFSIDPCAIPEINEAARTAIRQAAPFPPPPDLGAATYEVHGTLIFRP